MTGALTLIRRPGTWVAAWRLLFSLLIAYAFTTALMTAAAQQHIAAALSEEEPGLDYSSAFAMTVKNPALREDLAKRRAELQMVVKTRASV